MTQKFIQQYAFRKTALSLALLLLFSLAASAFNACLKLTDAESCERVELRSKSTGSESLIQHDQMALLKIEFSSGMVSFLCEIQSKLKSGGQSLPVKVGLTDSGYIAFSEWSLTRGTFITKDAYQLGRNVAVISESLAGKLFMSLNVIGNKITVLDKDYTIVGLYRPVNSLVTPLKSDGLEQIFIPLSSHQEMAQLPLQTIFIKSPSLAKETFKENTVRNTLLQKLHLNVDGYKIVTYDKRPALLAQFQDIFLFCIGLGMIIEIIKRLMYFWKESASTIKSSLADMYLRDFIRHRFLFCIRLFITSLAGMAAAFFVFRFIEPRLVLPSQYLPQENIFDLQFYIDQIKTAIQNHNASVGYQPTALDSSFFILLIINLTLVSLSIPALISLCNGIKLNKHLGVGLKTFIGIGIAAILVAVSGHMLFTCWGFYEWVFSPRSLLVLLTFYMLKCTTHEKARPLS